MFYIGKLCERHPELQGERRTSSRGCHKCIVERMANHGPRAQNTTVAQKHALRLASSVIKRKKYFSAGQEAMR